MKYLIAILMFLSYNTFGDEKVCYNLTWIEDIICAYNVAYLKVDGANKIALTVMYNKNGDVLRCECNANTKENVVITNY